MQRSLRQAQGKLFALLRMTWGVGDMVLFWATLHGASSKRPGRGSSVGILNQVLKTGGLFPI